MLGLDTTAESAPLPADVGSRLYISAKTIEHHVARIRRRLGAGSRSELLSMLRAMGHGYSADS